MKLLRFNGIRIFMIIASCCTSSLFSQPAIFHDYPDWVSQSLGHVATGLGIADINQDGWDDIVVANGNDMQRQNVVVYYNNQSGGFPTVPSWSSSDIDYHGHLSIGDIDGNGFPDVAVSTFLGAGGFSDPGYAKVYFNYNGQLQSLPGFATSDRMFTFSCALGDADGDGDLDLAVAGGQPYEIGMGPYQTYGRIYYNQAGVLDTLPGWTSQVTMGALDVEFADMDNNGFLDLLFACHLTPNYIFLADSAGQIQSAPSWNSQDISYYGNSLTVGKITNDAYLDLIISDNNQLGGQGKYKAYYFTQPPSGSSFPGWYSTTGGYGSAMLAADLNFNGRPDLITGRWWGRVEIYLDTLYTLNSSPNWWSLSNSVIEAYALRDVNQDGRFTKSWQIAVSQDSIHLLDLQDSGLEKIISLQVNGQTLDPGLEYCTIPGASWISTRESLLAGDQVSVEYIASFKQDLAVSNWDSDIGNYLFYNQTVPTFLDGTNPIITETLVMVYPNPFNQSCRFEFYLLKNSHVQLSIFDALGRRVKQLLDQPLEVGRHEVRWDGENDRQIIVTSGLYFYQLQTGNGLKTGKLLLLK